MEGKMKVKKGIVQSKVGDDFVLVPTGEAAKSFHGVVRLNETGVEIWNALEAELSEEEIVNKLMARYTDVDYETALRSVRSVTDKLKDAGLLE